MAHTTTSLSFIRSRIAQLEYRAEHYRSRKSTEALHFINEELQSMLQVEKDLLELQQLKGKPTTANA